MEKKKSNFMAVLWIMGILVFAGCIGTQDTDNANQKDDTIMGEDDGTPDQGEATEGDSTKVFSLTGVNFKFMMDGKENPTLTVTEGDTVRIEFKSTEGFHDWVLDEFKAATSKVQAPDATSVEFTASTAGTYEYYCSVGQHRQMGMKGRFIVESKDAMMDEEKSMMDGDDGVMEAAKPMGDSEGYVDISPAQAKQMIDSNPDLIVIDVSPRYGEGHLPGAVNYYVGDGSLDEAIPQLEKSADYLVYCHVDSAAIAGAQKLVDAGFKNVYLLEGNYAAWVDAGYPIET